MSSKVLSLFCAIAVPSVLFLGGCAEEIVEAAETEGAMKMDNTQSSEIGEASSSLQTSTVFEGCRGTGRAVCDELVDPIYFVHHPLCFPNTWCESTYYDCWSECPPPTGNEIPTANIKAAGALTSNMRLDIGILGAYGWYHNTLWNNSHVDEYGYGIGVSDTENAPILANCYTYDDTQITSLSILWQNGDTREIPCANQRCSTESIPFNGGVTVTCNLAR